MSPNMEPIPFSAQLECPYCRHVYDRSKLSYNTIINQYICLDCRQMLLNRSEQRHRTNIIRETHPRRLQEEIDTEEHV